MSGEAVQRCWQLSAGIDSADALKSTVEASVVLEGCLDFSCVNYHDSRA